VTTSYGKNLDGLACFHLSTAAIDAAHGLTLWAFSYESVGVGIHFAVPFSSGFSSQPRAQPFAVLRQPFTVSICLQSGEIDKATIAGRD
jgi:hypothetical protein